MTTTSPKRGATPLPGSRRGHGRSIRAAFVLGVSASLLSYGPVAQAPAGAASLRSGPDAPSSASGEQEVAPASSFVGLTEPTKPTAAAPAVLAPAVHARLTADAQARRATARAVAGARSDHSRPVEGTRLSSPFGMRWGRLHAGVDFAGPVGQAVRAVTSGTVTAAGPAQGYGRLIEIRHEDGSFSRYGHLHRVDVKVGQRVGAAQVIGALGNAGRSTGPHLHFEIRTPQGRPIDPMPWLKRYRIVPVETSAR